MMPESVRKYYERERPIELRPVEYGRYTGKKLVDALVALIEAGYGDKAEAHWRLHVINANKSWLEPDQADSLIDVLD